MAKKVSRKEGRAMGNMRSVKGSESQAATARALPLPEEIEAAKLAEAPAPKLEIVSAPEQPKGELLVKEPEQPKAEEVKAAPTPEPTKTEPEAKAAPAPEQLKVQTPTQPSTSKVEPKSLLPKTCTCAICGYKNGRETDTPFARFRKRDSKLPQWLFEMAWDRKGGRFHEFAPTFWVRWEDGTDQLLYKELATSNPKIEPEAICFKCLLTLGEEIVPHISLFKLEEKIKEMTLQISRRAADEAAKRAKLNAYRQKVAQR